MSLPQNIFDEAVEVFGRRFLFVYPDPSGRYGICSNCGNTVGYDEQPLPSKHGGDQYRYAECPHCMATLEVRRGWYGKASLKDRFYLQAWEVIDYNTVKLHEAIIALDGRTDTADEAGAWESETCYDQRCTTLTPWHCETVRWDGSSRRVSAMCPPTEQMGCNITPYHSAWHPMTDQVCVMGWSRLKKSFIAPFVKAYEQTHRRQENAPNFIFRMIEEPITELFFKNGYFEIAHERAYKTRPSLGTRHIDFAQKSPKKMFRGLKKNGAEQKMKELLRLIPTNTKIWQLEKCAQLFLDGTLKKPEDAAAFCRIDTYEYSFDETLRDLLKYGYSAARFIRYLGDCGESMRYYMDYLGMCEELGKPTYEQRVLFPEHLRAAHDVCVDEKKNLHAKALKELGKKRRTDLIARGYEFTSGGVCSLVPTSLQDIKDEGAALRHCVGGYADKYADGITNIVFIRKTADRSSPWFTLEVDPKTLAFRQCYGYRNEVKGRDDPEVAPFLEKYARHLKRCASKNKIQKQEVTKCQKTA